MPFALQLAPQAVRSASALPSLAKTIGWSLVIVPARYPFLPIEN